MDCYQFAAKKDFELEHGRNRGQLQAPDPSDPPIKRIKFYLDKYKIKEALQVFFHSDTIKVLKEEPDFMWDAIPMICSRLRGLCQFRFRVFEGCEKMLCRIAVEESCNPKEVLISLLAEINQCEEQDDDNVFRAMIRPLEGTLLRMSSPSPREENFRWTLNVLMRHVNDIEMPQEYDIEGDKRLSLPNDPSVRRFVEVLPSILSFIEEFNDRPIDHDRSPMPVLTESQIDEVLNGELVDDGDYMNDISVPARCDITDASITALLHLTQRPLVFLDTTDKCKELNSVAIRCLSLLLRLVPDLFAPIYKQTIPTPTATSDQILETTADGLFSNISSLATTQFDGSSPNAMLTLATSAYIFRYELKSNNIPSASTSTSPQPPVFPMSFLDIVQSFPQILTHESILFCHIPYVLVLLRKTEILAQEKGLLLLNNLLELIKPNSLGANYYESFITLTVQLFNVMVFSPYSMNRRRAHEKFTKISDLLTFECKLDLFRWILRQTKLTPCIRATSIDHYRRQIGIIHKELDRLSRELELSADSDNCCEIERQINYWQAGYKLLGGQGLVDFIDQSISSSLPESQHTDIVENYELILATLAMFRFLRLNRNRIREDRALEKYLCDKEVKKNFLDPVRSAMRLVMNELRLHQEEQTAKIKTNVVDETSAGGQFDEVECLKYVMCRLDLVDSVLVKTCDLYNC